MVFKSLSQFYHSPNTVRSSNNIVTSVLGRLLFDQSYKRGAAFYSVSNGGVLRNTTTNTTSDNTDASSASSSNISHLHHKKKKHTVHHRHGAEHHKDIPVEEHVPLSKAAEQQQQPKSASHEDVTSGAPSGFSTSYFSKQYDDSTEDDINAEKSTEALPWDRERESKILGKKANEIDEIKWNEAEDKPHSNIYKKAEEVFVLKKEIHILENSVNRDASEKGLNDDRQQQNEPGRTSF
ncbi:hypothetical protein FDP41_012075 [Naegleria fowleri]|uniref:Uncharacterized protein n=1 Tax=Naegleria fowleri TaxID=5763 RepID=A0A6A5C6L8_NAEFO|nr:uncharacterized protein FDP41_012075 [Naegleria fowleri]KAF0981418.1 hypothetical protein FDP41_012075 [Naegleria fowleri]CAG4718640.1 unnamed protein product [Naegleria fowleri]